ncbi:uncharacterized protein V1510DRAFT_125494 [Dipodascopsis tothii]|uniref:uncharacterized protein n=1 Tax=Dipodascopsis tothii TaxID=44089 RepID=UPI0034CDEA6E
MALVSSSMADRSVGSLSREPSQERSRHTAVEVALRFHEERVVPDVTVFDESLLAGSHEGDVVEVLDMKGNRLHMFTIAPLSAETRRKLPNVQLSVLTGSCPLASYRTSRVVRVRWIARSRAEADLIMFFIKDINLTRAEMWYFPASLKNTCVFHERPIEFMKKTFTLSVQRMYKDGKSQKISYMGADTRAVFRSQSVKYLIFLQMSREMWYFDETGESYFNKVLNSFLPELFRRWREADTHHLISIIMFTSLDLDACADALPPGVRSTKTRDYFRIVVDRMKVSDWTEIMATLRREFVTFLKSVLVQENVAGDGAAQIVGAICPAVKGNILEAVNFAATQVSRDLLINDSQRTGMQTMILSPGTGLFDVEIDLLHRSTQNLMDGGLSVDFICLTRMPLHAVPLFRYRSADNDVLYCMPHWADVSYWNTPKQLDSGQWVPRCRIYEIQMMGVMENELSAISIDYLPASLADMDEAELGAWMNRYDNDVMTNPRPMAASNSSRGGYSNPLWTMIANPSNPTEEENLSAIMHGNWKHLYPRKTRNRAVKWRSLISPAALPVTTEAFPAPEDFYSEYTCQAYEIRLGQSAGADQLSMEDLLREMVSLRICCGYQIVIGAVVTQAEMLNPVSPLADGIVQDVSGRAVGVRMYFSLGNYIQRICCTSDQSVHVQLYRRRFDNPDLEFDLIYRPMIQTPHETEFHRREVRFNGTRRTESNWVNKDNLLAGNLSTLVENHKFYRSRFVLIPMEMQNGINTNRVSLFMPRQAGQAGGQPVVSMDAMSPEEIRLDALRKLNASFYRAQHLTAEEQRRLRSRKKAQTVPELKFYTGYLSAYISQLLESTGGSEAAELTEARDSLMSRPSERFTRDVKLAALAQDMQSERGIRLVDRRWHWKLHQHCFLGTDYVAWLLNNFKDIDTVEEAVEYGNELMKAGLFHHVEHRHSFLHGHYFYQINPEYSTAANHPPAKSGGWLSTIREAASGVANMNAGNVSMGPLMNTSAWDDTTPPPGPRSRAGSIKDADASLASTASVASPDLSLEEAENARSAVTETPRIELSTSLRINVDPGRKSFRNEIVMLHFDRLHNPESCYHLRLEWLNTTPKLIEEMIGQWSRMCERSGLKMVEVPVDEVCALKMTDPFASFSEISFAVDPCAIEYDDGVATTTDGRRNEYDEVEPHAVNPMFYHEQALLKLDYVLDTEAKDSFESIADVDITYSWGRPHFRHPQYVHKSGTTLVELNAETGTFTVTSNPLAATRMGVQSTSAAAVLVDPETIRREMVDFVANRPDELREFFASVRSKWLDRPGVAVPYSSPPQDSVLQAGPPAPPAPPPEPPAPEPPAHRDSYLYYDLRMF